MDQTENMKLIVGLGNPGRTYSSNRHNIGFTCLRYFARQVGIRFDKKEDLARTGSGEVGGNKVVLARPQTFMNLSGRSVSRLVKKFSINHDDLIIIHDELDLPLGRIRIRQDSSSGGHKGVSSIINELGSQDFIRIRVGIGRPASDIPETSEADIVDYVLSDFTAEEKKTMAQVIPKVSEAIYCLLTEGLTAAMNKYN
jgi:PTH1 family peptidyl-tRNA hydrolase